MSENEQSWTRPTTIFTLVGLLISISANVFLFYNSNRKYTLDEAKTKIEADKINIDNGRIVSNNELSLRRIAEIKPELNEIDSAIVQYDEIISKNKIDKAIATHQYSSVPVSQSNDTKKYEANAKSAFQKNIDLSQSEIDRATHEKAPLLERKNKLEAERDELLKSLK